jgi:pimeloyl-ACP methyl ester carboxylesterase
MDVVDNINWRWRDHVVRLSVTRIGAGPTIVLLPALSSISTREEMRLLQELLARDHTTISVDWPGFGEGPKPFVDWRPDALRAFLDHLLTDIAPRPLATIAVGHAAAYVLQQSERAPRSAGALCLIAPTWRGPLPTVSGKPAASFQWFVHLVDVKGIGALVYALNVNPAVVGMMMRGHVYSNRAMLTPALFAQKLAVTRAAGARHASVRFVSGLLDPADSRAAFLAGARRVSDPVLLVYGADTPRKSRAEMEALSALPQIERKILPRGKLAVQEEYPAAVAESMRAFLKRI